MKALSLLQPWASLVITGAKQLETRSWSTKHRGHLLIHASTGRAGALLTSEPPFSKYIDNFNQLPFGAIIGQVTLADVVSVEQLQLSDVVINHLTLEERAFGDYTKGRFAWVLEEPIQFTKPIPLTGTLGLWEYNGAL
jgi:hypothetical protein